jgi:hypothetical protein
LFGRKRITAPGNSNRQNHPNFVPPLTGPIRNPVSIGKDWHLNHSEGATAIRLGPARNEHLLLAGLKRRHWKEAELATMRKGDPR